MSILFLHRPSPMYPSKRIRRSATAVMAGTFDPRPARDVLTSLLNGVAPYKVVEKDEESRRTKKREKRERDRERKRQKAALRAEQKALMHEAGFNATADTSCASTSLISAHVHTTGSTSSFWRARPAIHIATMQRSISVTPPPITSPMLLPSTPASTPGPCDSSSTSRTSSKRPLTPDDFDDFDGHGSMSTASPSHQRRKRQAVKKGWKGWVEGSPPPSEKLINLDAVPVLQERRTRSGKNFDAIGVGKDGWV